MTQHFQKRVCVISTRNTRPIHKKHTDSLNRNEWNSVLLCCDVIWCAAAMLYNRVMLSWADEFRNSHFYGKIMKKLNWINGDLNACAFVYKSFLDLRPSNCSMIRTHTVIMRKSRQKLLCKSQVESNQTKLNQTKPNKTRTIAKNHSIRK